MADAASIGLADKVQEQVQRHGIVGVSERQIARALAHDEMAGNINAVDLEARKKDIEFYAGMPMHGQATDPTNAEANTAAADAIMARLRENAAEANARAPEPAPRPKPKSLGRAAPTPALTGARAAIARCQAKAAGLLHDLRHWDAVPGNTTVLKCRQVMHGRFELIVGFLVFVLILISLCKCFAS